MNYENINYNEVLLSGNINSIYDKSKYIIFGLTCNNYSKEQSNKCFISLRIYEDLYYKYKDFFVKGNKIFIKGYLNSYSDKDRNIANYVMVTDISNNPNDIVEKKNYPHIRYDDDGVMIWNGKKCEANLPSEKEKKEIENLLNEFK